MRAQMLFSSTHMPRATWPLRAGLLACALLLGACTHTGPQGRADLRTSAEQGQEMHRAQIRYELAMGYFEQGKDRIALDEVNQVLQLLPSSVDAWILRGLIYMRLNEDANAMDSLRRAQALDANNATAANNLGLLHCRAKNYNEAFAQFNKAIAAGGVEASRSYMNLALCQVQAGDSKSAEASFRQSLERDPMNPISNYNLGQLLYQQQQYEQARFYLRRLNNSEFANAQTLWLGLRIERILNNHLAYSQLASQLRSRFAHSHEADLLEREVFDDPSH